ncbi:solute carrier family 15 member 2-like isoform X2 [Pomacea canaliculata]|uniref:solute carrier family 15 member 2-like isoform X2 n=1 Tax=Pomacea canaliculata TaxID=400727 RepID=UPI000D731CB2|nr:solute carrier family 15 member 2-like isoform X2 [Pomacea canaliculata]
MNSGNYGATEGQNNSQSFEKKDEHLLRSPKVSEKKAGARPVQKIKNFFNRKSQYPTSVFFILGTEFCERFSYYGLRSILVLYLTQWLGMGKNAATAMFHTFSFFAYFSPIFGAVIADSFLGRYRTILYISAVYGLGCTILSLTALPPPEVPGPVIGLLLISLGTGGIKPCVVTFGGDQFTSDQVKLRNTFFSIFYLMINLGSVISTLITPILRADVHCIQDSCYPLAFAVPALLMFISVVIFFAGRHQYKHVPPTGSLFTKVFKCILHGIQMKCKYSKYQEGKNHWLEYAGDKYEMSFIEDVKRLLNVLWLFLPLPIFWALYNQQGSRWTLQAAELDGRMGALGRLKPDQLQALNPLLIILLIPVFEKMVYPLLESCRIPNSQLQRMAAGMTFVTISFCLAGLVQIKIDDLKDTPLSGNAGYTILNAADCPIHIDGTPSPFFSGTIHPLQASPYQLTSAGQKEVSLSCEDQTQSFSVNMEPNKSWRLILTGTNNSLSLRKFEDRRQKSSDGQALVSVADFSHLSHTWYDVHIVPTSNSKARYVNFNISMNNATEFQELEPGDYDVALPAKDHEGHITWKKSGQPFTLGSGGVYTVVLLDTVYGESANVSVIVFMTVQENSLSMFYMVPQYIVITVGEIMFSISGLGFAYAQAPQSMRSVVQAAWLLTTAFGDLIVVIVAEVRLLPNQMSEFFLFAGLLLVDVVIFTIMAAFYKCVKMEDEAVVVNKTADDTGLINSSFNEEMPLQDKD